MLNARIFKRVDDLYERRDDLDLTDEQRRVLERATTGFVRAGAKLGAKQKARVAEINERLATLATQFSQNVLKDEQSWRLVLEAKRDLAACRKPLRDAAARAAADAGPCRASTSSRCRARSIEPFLQFSAPPRPARGGVQGLDPARRECGKDTDNRADRRRDRRAARRVRAPARLQDLRRLQPRRHHGQDARQRCAGCSSAVWGRRGRSAPPASATRCSRGPASEGGNFAIAPWDWRYYAEKERKARFDLDEAAIAPYLELDNMIAAAFDTATPAVRPQVQGAPRRAALSPGRARLGGDRQARRARRPVPRRLLRARPRSARAPGCRPSARSTSSAGEVTPDHRQRHELRQGRGRRAERCCRSTTRARCSTSSATACTGCCPTSPIRRSPARPCRATSSSCPRSSTSTGCAARGARARSPLHYKTGKPMPEQLLERFKTARNFNQGFATVEYTASALRRHGAARAGGRRARSTSTRFERETLDRIGMPREIVMRHRMPHFLHIMGGYAAGYYSYLWSEVMDADAFAAFEEAGNVVRPRRPRRSCTSSSIRPATGATRSRPTSRSAAARRRSTACCSKRGLAACVRRR